jgi:5-formyltetrahydrofolate cyclo-ligase
MAQGLSKESYEKIKELASSGIITYSPLFDEVDPEKYISFTENIPIYKISANSLLDPFIEAEKVTSIFKDTSPVIFIPGKKFDVSGTRHGRGGGWYDRFLSSMPNTWIRVGFCYEEQFSDIPLIRESWDVPVDFVYISKKESADFKFIKTLV